MQVKNCTTLSKRTDCKSASGCGWVAKEGCKKMRLSGKNIYIAVHDKALKSVLKKEIERQGGKPLVRFGTSANFFVTESSSYKKDKTSTIEKGSLVKAFVKKYGLNVPSDLLTRIAPKKDIKEKKTKTEKKATNRVQVDALFRLEKSGVNPELHYRGKAVINGVMRQLGSTAKAMFERQGYEVRHMEWKTVFFDKSNDAFIIPMRIRTKSSYDKLQAGQEKGKNEIVLVEMRYLQKGRVSMLGYRTVIELKHTEKYSPEKILSLIKDIYGKDLYIPGDEPMTGWWRE